MFYNILNKALVYSMINIHFIMLFSRVSYLIIKDMTNKDLINNLIILSPAIYIYVLFFVGVGYLIKQVRFHEQEMKKLCDAEYNLSENNIGNLENVYDHYILTVNLRQFLEKENNKKLVIEYFRDKTNLKYLCGIVMKSPQLFDNYEFGLFCKSSLICIDKEIMYGSELFTDYHDNSKYNYIPIVLNNNVTYFTTFGELNYIRTIIEIGLLDEVINNKEYIIDKIIRKLYMKIYNTNELEK